MKQRLAHAPAVIAVAAELGDAPGVGPDSPLAWLALVDDARGSLDAVRSSPLCAGTASGAGPSRRPGDVARPIGLANGHGALAAP